MKVSTIANMMAATFLAACASGGAMAASSGATRDPNVISAAELAKENSPNVYEAIQHLRPEMLRPRQSNATSSIAANTCTTPQTDANGGTVCLTHPGDYVLHVYMDQAALGEIPVMKSIPIANVKEIRYLNPQQALMKFGSGNPGGVILLTSR